MTDSGIGGNSGRESNLITVGEIAGAYGVRGWVKVRSHTEPESNIVEYSPWWLKTRHGVKKVEVDDGRNRPQGLVVHIRDIDDRDQAAALRGVKIAVERDQLPDLQEGEYYWHQLIGLRVTSVHGGQESELGRVKNLLETGANDVLVVQGGVDCIDERERLIPYLPGSVVVKVELERGVLQVDWDPEF